MKIIKIHFETIGSTNTWAKEHVHEWDPAHMTLITANEQTAGRGRFKRQWESPAGVNLYATFCFFVDSQQSDLGHIPQLLALSTAQILEPLGFSPRLKWPNDLMLNRKKVAGILCETTTVESRRCVICGIGLNINMPLKALQEIDRPATSLLVEGQQKYDVKQICELLSYQFTHQLIVFLEKGFDNFFVEFDRRSYFQKGETVQFHDNQNLVHGAFERLNLDGSVTLKLEDGTLIDYYAGEFIY